MTSEAKSPDYSLTQKASGGRYENTLHYGVCREARLPNIRYRLGIITQLAHNIQLDIYDLRTTSALRATMLR